MRTYLAGLVSMHNRVNPPIVISPAAFFKILTLLYKNKVLEIYTENGDEYLIELPSSLANLIYIKYRPATGEITEMDDVSLSLFTALKEQLVEHNAIFSNRLSTPSVGSLK